MAITNAQQFKQLVNPPMKGKTRPGYRGEAAAASAAASDRGMQGRSVGSDPQGRGDGPATNDRGVYATRDPMAQFTGNVNTKNLKFMDEARRRANPLGVLTQIPGGIGMIARFLTPNPFGFAPKPSVTSVGGGGGDSQGIIGIPTWMRLGFSSEAEYLASLEKEDEKEDEGLRLAFRADGGPIGGEYDFESARQMYGLGKLVKKVTRTVKKIAKSPIGKAALIGAAGFGIPGTSLGGIFGRASFGGFAPGVFGFGGIGNAAIAAKAKLFGSALPPSQGLGKTKGLLDFVGGKAGAGIIGASALAGLLTPEEEQQAQELADNTGFDIEKARNSILAARREQYMMDERARGFRAEGGPAEGKEPVAKKTMPLLDMGGQEMDLRAEGGFVPIGRMEKADDVPARLSKNEFVFTADAVRNAGDGDVDKGAEVMYNMMKNLESGGDVSEESQGLEGARKMFQTSQRLEEVL